MDTSIAIKMALAAKGISQSKLAEHMGMTKQGMCRKIKCNAWYVRDLTNAIHELTGAKLILRLDNGVELELTDGDEAQYLESEKKQKRKMREAEAELVKQYDDHIETLSEED